jgi:hypothetical protein
MIAAGLAGRGALSFEVRLLADHITADLSSTCRSYTPRAIPLEAEAMTTRQAFGPDITSMDRTTARSTIETFASRRM